MSSSMKSRAFQRIDTLKQFLTPREVFVLKLSLVEDQKLVELLAQDGDDKELIKQLRVLYFSSQEAKPEAATQKPRTSKISYAVIATGLVIACFLHWNYIMDSVMEPLQTSLNWV